MWDRRNVDVNIGTEDRPWLASAFWADRIPSFGLEADTEDENELFIRFASSVRLYLSDRIPGFTGRHIAESNGEETIALLTAKEFQVIKAFGAWSEQMRKEFKGFQFYDPDFPKMRVLDVLAWQMVRNSTPEFVAAWQERHGPLSVPERVGLKSPPGLRRGGMQFHEDLNGLLLRCAAACEELLANHGPKNKPKRSRAIHEFIGRMWNIWRATPAAAAEIGKATEQGSVVDLQVTPSGFLGFLENINAALPPNAKLAPDRRMIADVIRTARPSTPRRKEQPVDKGARKRPGKTTRR